jgi:hypothetical protein
MGCNFRPGFDSGDIAMHNPGKMSFLWYIIWNCFAEIMAYIRIDYGQ